MSRLSEHLVKDYALANNDIEQLRLPDCYGLTPLKVIVAVHRRASALCCAQVSRSRAQAAPRIDAAWRVQKPSVDILGRNQASIGMARVDRGGLAPYRPAPVDPLAERRRPTRSHFAWPPAGAASMDTVNAALLPGGKPFNSKRPYNRVHRQHAKNPYDRLCR